MIKACSCPFCREENIIVDKSDEFGRHCRCTWCWACGPIIIVDNLYSDDEWDRRAIEAWNMGGIK